MERRIALLAVLASTSFAAGLCGCNEIIPGTDPKCPTVTGISSPETEQTFKPGTEIILTGGIEQKQTVDLTTLDVKWVINGNPSDGSSFETVTIEAHPLADGSVKSALEGGLPAGSFTAKLVGLDTVYQGECSSKTVEFFVRNQAPTVVITEPTEQVIVNPDDEVVITGTVSDPDPDDAPESLTLSLQDEQEPSLVYTVRQPSSDGKWSISAYFSTYGLHSNVYVFVHDSAGSSGQDGPIEVLVNECDSTDKDKDQYSECDRDCDDSNPNVHPGLEEVCNDGLDNDCDGQTDIGLDHDGDDFDACDESSLGDCDDNDPKTYPGATEQCNNVDDNCDGVVPPSEIDDDGDGQRECDGDCDDADPITYYGASQMCDGKDNGCDAGIPLGEQDLDDDGVMACEEPDPDCDDHDFYTSPKASEICDNGNDDNCNGAIDEEFDLDGDGYSTCAKTCPVGICSDCDDYNASVYPGAPEGPDDGDGIPESDGLDNDCDGVIDNDTSDVDDDGDGYSEQTGDCDDYNFYTYPGALERPDLQDNNCDGQAEGTLTLARAHVILRGKTVGGRVGSSVSSGTDVNGDGIDDLLVGAYTYDYMQTNLSRGAAFLLFGRTQGWANLNDVLIDDNALLFYEDEPGAKAGYSVAMAGDMNGDGYGDFGVGAPYHSIANADNVGRAYMMFGKPSGWASTTLTVASTSTVEPVTILPESSNTMLGYAIAGGGDVNDDGYDDLLVGLPWSSQTGAPGWLLIVPGKYEPYSAKLGPSELCRIMGDKDNVIGQTAAITGNNNGDSIPDLAVGGTHDYPNSVGSAYSVLGNPGFTENVQYSLTGLYSPEYYGTNQYDYVGDSLSGSVDLDNDGYDEILVGRRNSAETTNLAYVIFGRTTLPPTGNINEVPGMIRFIASLSDQDDCPCSVQGIGDFNGDGLGDMAVGVTRNSENGDSAGKIYIFFGRSSRSAWADDWGTNDIADVSLDTADIMILGEEPDDQAGQKMAAGDVNGDGSADLIVTSERWGEDKDQYGTVYILFGSPLGHRSPYK